MDKKKVLVVDDEIHIVHVVAIKLRNNGYEVISAENGQQGYELACEEKPDIIITDFQMPILNGLEFVQKGLWRCAGNIFEDTGFAFVQKIPFNLYF